ncbi:hypothetical protein N431DRAFT_447154 [Stipitochalara longipes BDJ]|nr:hypothetical protein N431DRAFT_447154 [Stipitochalara longipes BDJ]
MPGFGASYKPVYQPSGIKYYVDVFMTLIKQLGIPKFHVLGHHSGARIAVELAVLHLDQVLTLSVVGLAAMTPQEQKKFADTEIVMFNKPVADGSHFLKVWDYLDVIGLDVVNKHYQTLDNARAYEGRIQIYTYATFVVVGGNNFEVMRDAPGVTNAMIGLYSKL